MNRLALYILISQALWNGIVGDFGESCQLQRMSPESTVGLIARRSSRKQCSNTEQLELANCVGTCHSSTRYNSEKRLFDDTHCSCCRPLTWNAVTISMPCNDGDTYSQEIQVPASCGCSGCDSEKKHIASEADKQV